MAAEPALSCDGARSVSEADGLRAWSLTWDEDDWNHADEDPAKRERWEGVINRGSEYFPQVGGPPSPDLNTRTEVAFVDGGMKLRTFGGQDCTL